MANDKVKATGKYVIGHWRPGVIGSLLAAGIPLARAQWLARIQGHLLRVDRAENMVVSDGLNLIAQRLMGTGVLDITWHSIGTTNTAPASNQHALIAEVGRLQLASRTVAANQLSVAVFYWASQSAFNIQEVGMWGGAASSTPGSGTLFSRALYPYDNSAGLVDLTFDYVLTLLSV